MLDGAVAPAGTPVSVSGVGEVLHRPEGYSCTVPFGWSGSVTLPSYDAFPMAFDVMPPVRNYSGIIDNQSGQNFNVTSQIYVISGKAYVQDTAAPTTIQLTNGTDTVTSNGTTGDYQFSVQGGWSGTVVPTHLFTDPVQRSYATVQENHPDQTFYGIRPSLEVVSESVISWTATVVPDRWFVCFLSPEFTVFGTTAGDTLSYEGFPEIVPGTTVAIIGVDSSSEPVTLYSNTYTTEVPLPEPDPHPPQPPG